MKTKTQVLKDAFINLAGALNRKDPGRAVPFALDPTPSDEGLRNAQAVASDLLLEIAEVLGCVDVLCEVMPEVYRKADARDPKATRN